MDALDLARWQFGITTVYHFLFVPLTIGLSVLVAGMQTAWYRTGKAEYLRMTKFFGKLFLINFAMGVVTGIVQEFQFGMNWSDYSRFVGDVFGAPLAMEALLAFFLESTFLGLWIFGWDRLPKGVHLTTIWLAAIGSNISAFFILAANSWMQNPVGFRFNQARDRAELTDIWAVLTNKVALVTVPHTLAGAFLGAGAFVVAVSSWWLWRRRDSEHTPMFRKSLRLGLVVTVLAGAGTLVTGDVQGKIMTEVQPMKMAAAEALYETRQPASFSLLTIGTLDGRTPLWSLEVPHLLSWLATGDLNGKVEGINDLQAQYQQRFGPGDYVPYIPVTYWNFRLMIGFGMLAALVALAGLWLTRRGRLPDGKWIWMIGVATVVLPILANSTGWIFTEMGRQPWTVFSLLETVNSVSPGVPAWQVWVSLSAFTLLYLVLAIVEVGLTIHYAKAGPPDETASQGESAPAFAY